LNGARDAEIGGQELLLPASVQQWVLQLNVWRGVARHQLTLHLCAYCER
jgi:hypothetical protein